MVTPSQIRTAFAERIEDEQLSDYHLHNLTRFVARLPDERAARVIELINVGLDAPRRGRAAVLWLVDNELRQPDPLLHDECIAFLRWIVAARVPHTRGVGMLAELRDARSDAERARLVLSLSDPANGVSLATAHPVMADAWKTTPDALRPHDPMHRGEPEPEIGSRGMVHLALFLARAVAHLVRPADAPRFAELIELAQDAVDRGEPSAALARAAQTPRRGPLGVARAACAEADLALRVPTRAGSSTRAAAANVVRLLLRAGGGDPVRRFLADLDEELRRLDVVDALSQRSKQPSRPIARSLFRAGDRRGKVVLWLARLEGRENLYGLLAKHGRSWRWAEGGRDEILATIPDEHFERAVMAAKDDAVR